MREFNDAVCGTYIYPEQNEELLLTSRLKDMVDEKDLGTVDWREHQEFILDVYVTHRQVTETTESKCWIPRYCFLTGKNLFLDRATKLTRQYGEIKPRKETIWVDSKAYVMFLLKQGKSNLA